MALHLSLPSNPGPEMLACDHHSPTRRSGNYKANIWHDEFLQSLKDDYREEVHVRRAEKLTEAARCLLIEEKKDDIVDQIKLIDSLQQLGLSYHFEKEIKHSLSSIFEAMDEAIKVVKDDLYATSLLFRLLRENGFFASQDVFVSFKDENGKFKASLCRDIKGMISLYEASYLATKRDNVLHEAREFSSKHLKAILDGHVDQPLKEYVTHALELPLRWRMLRLHTPWFIDMYAKENSMNPLLLEFAKLDYNMVQSMYRKELKERSRWWTDLNLLEGKLSFARDRRVENYLWAIGGAPEEPKFESLRKTLMEVISFATDMDDIYDVYGSLDELELFTDAIQRWDVNAIEQLPEYMQIYFLALFNTTNARGYHILKTKGVNAIPYLKKSWADLSKAYLKEAKWYHSGYTPTFDEYLENAWVTVSGGMVHTHGFFYTTENITKEALEKLAAYPGVLRRTSAVVRLVDDLQTATAELARGDVQKSMQCYMHEKGVSESVAREYVKEVIRDIWEEINGDCFNHSPFDYSFVLMMMNLSRIGQSFYQYEDGYGDPSGLTKGRIKQLMFEPIPLSY